ncbi:MAG: tetratricopeptide repeat protein [Gammaproteobacteria bacterium]|nr:tetratricopeptide repeat protein [Gammaproteobacteria bacterium]
MSRSLTLGKIDRFYRELRRRKVIRVAAFYIVASWVAIEVASVVFPELMLPKWSVRLVILLAALGFPFVIMLAWIFDITPGGVQRTPEVAAASAKEVVPQAAPPQRSLAVLPFRNIGGDRENEYFCEGLAEDLLIVLSRVQGLRVAARSSAFAFRDDTSDVRTIGEKLNVANVLEGSVRKSDGHLRIAVRLVDTADGYQRWTQVFDRELGDIFAIQDEISRAVFDALDVEIYGAKCPQIVPGTHDIEAYNLYLMGRHQFHKRTEESLRSAVRFFEQATERDPRFALPYSGLADAYALLSASGEGYGPIPVEEAIARAAPMVERALELDPRLAEAHASLGFLDRLRHDSAGAERALRHALELNPDYPMAHAWLGLTLTDLGRLREARAEFERAYEADPLSPIIGSNLGFAQLKSGELEAAREHFRRVIEIAPEFTVAHSGMAHIERKLGRLEKAQEWWERASHINPNRAYYPASLALLQLEAESPQAAEHSVQRAEAISPNDPLIVRARMTVLIAAQRDAELLSFTEDRLEGERSGAETLANAALAQLVTGQPDKALRYYERAGGDLQQWTSDALVWTWRFPHGLHYANALLLTGARERGLALLEEADRLFDRLERDGLVNPDLDYQRAGVLALRGDLEAAATAFQRAVQGGWRTHWWGRRDPTLAALRERKTLSL